jgi:hypothetical protein
MPDALIPLAGIVMPVVLVPAIMGMRHARQKREWEHLERMRALEMGQPLPGREAWASAAAIAIGAAVPIAAMFVALVASLNRSIDEIAPVAGTIGMSGVIGGSILAARLIGSRARSKQSDSGQNGKPLLDPDAYDVAGRRG